MVFSFMKCLLCTSPAYCSLPSLEHERSQNTMMGYMEPLLTSGLNWFQGTADAVRQYLWLFEEHNVLEFLVLAGDHLYRMDYEKFIQAHRETDADITVAALPMDEKRATAFGLMKIDEEGRIIEFAEKPKGEQLKAMKVKNSLK